METQQRQDVSVVLDRPELKSNTVLYEKRVWVARVIQGMISECGTPTGPTVEELDFMIKEFLTEGTEWIYFESWTNNVQRCNVVDVSRDVNGNYFVEIRWISGPKVGQVEKVPLLGDTGFIVPVQEVRYTGMRYYPV